LEDGAWDDIEGNLLPPEMKLLDAIPHVLNRAYDWKMAQNRRDLEKIAIKDLRRKYENPTGDTTP
jgi:hypothetical protein